MECQAGPWHKLDRTLTWRVCVCAMACGNGRPEAGGGTDPAAAVISAPALTALAESHGACQKRQAGMPGLLGNCDFCPRSYFLK